MTNTMTDNTRGKISPLAAWALAFGCAVGWGSFVMPGTIFLPSAGPLGTVLGVIVGGLIMAVIAWNYHVMMNHHPGPGGAYAYASAAFGIDHGFLCAWFLVLAYVAIVWANATALAIVARYTLGGIFSFGFRYTFAGFEVCLGDILLSGFAIAIAAAICLKRRLACAVDTVFAVGFGLGIVVCFAAAAAKHSGGIAAAVPAFAPTGAHPVAQMLKIVSLSPWLFVGFESISHASGEFAFPRKKSFAIMVASLVASVLAYSLLALLPALMHSGSGDAWPEYLARLFEDGGGIAIPTFDTVRNAIGRAGVALMGVTMFGAIFTGLVGNTFAASRLLAAMADDGILPARYDRRNGDGSPSYAVFAIAAVSVLVPFLGRTAIGLIVDVSTVGAAIAYAYTSAAAWKLSRGDRISRCTGICGVALSAAVLILFIVPNYVSGSMMATESYLLLVLWCIFGFVFFRSVFRRDKNGRFGKSTVVWIAILTLITVMSLLWMRQITTDTTRQVFDEIVQLHDHVLPHATEAEEKHWIGDMEDLRGQMNTMMLRGGLVQTGLMALAFAILANLGAMLRRHEHSLLRDKVRHRRERDREREKSKARSYFFSTVSHDIRTPLNAIIGFSEMLKDPSQSEAERTQAVDSILVSSKTLLALINDVLDLSKLESGKMEILPEPTDCPKLLQDVMEAMRVAKGRAGLELRCRTGDMPHLMLDPQRLRQITFNLVGNAEKFTEKGHVELRARYDRDEGAATGTFRLDVEDTGCGISEEDLKRIATPYVQVGANHGHNGGTGLGLAICRHLAKAMGGKLEIDSELGKGSTFSLILYGVEAVGDEAESGKRDSGFGIRDSSSKPGSSKSAERRILIVDDQKMNLMVLKSMLKKQGQSNVTMAADGSEALEILRASGAEPFDLVFTDLWMPNLDGEGLVKAIRGDAALATLRVVVVTADVEVKSRFAEMGFDDILLKPITFAMLDAVLKGNL